MSTAAHAGPAAMPSARSSRAPHFSGDEDELLTEFLREYEDLADGCRLTPGQKVKTILRYIPRALQHLWTTMPGYQAGDWDGLRADLEDLYPDVTALFRNTKQCLDTFRELSAKSRVRDEAGVLKYYRNFLTVATPLLANHRITIDEFNTAFFKGFHHSIQDIIAERFEKVYPHHPVHEPFPVQGVLDAARRHFTSNHFHRPTKSQKGKFHDKHRGNAKRYHDSPDAFIQRTYGATGTHSFRKRRSRTGGTADPDSDSDSDSSADSDSGSTESSGSSSQEYKTKHVRVKHSRSSRARSKGDNDPLALVTKLQGLSVDEPSYLVLYTQCQKRFPEIAQNLPKPQLLPAASSLASVAYQSNRVATQLLQPQLHPQIQLAAHPPTISAPAPAPTSTPATADPKTDFFYGARRAQGCAFCGHPRHRIHSCPAAEEYVDTGRVKIINRRLYLPTGQPIQNDGRGLGLKAGVDAWLAANNQYSSTSAAAPTTQRDPPLTRLASMLKSSQIPQLPQVRALQRPTLAQTQAVATITRPNSTTCSKSSPHGKRTLHQPPKPLPPHPLNIVLREV